MSGYVHPPQLDIRLSAAYDDREERPFAVAVDSVGYFGVWPKNTDFAALRRGIEEVVARHTQKRRPAVDACGLVKRVCGAGASLTDSGNLKGGLRK